MATTDDVIFAEDPRAARPRPDLVFWESRRGNFFLDEESARRDGRTHNHCKDCEAACPPYRTWCDKCKAVRDRVAWLELPVTDYGEDCDLLFEYDSDKVFHGEDEALDECAHRGIRPEQMMLVTAEPSYLHIIDYEDRYSDDLPDDRSLRDMCPEVADAFDALNEVIGENKHVLAYWPSGKRYPLTTPPDWEQEQGGGDV